MAKLVLGKSPEELAQEQAEQERQREMEVQKRIEERQKKLDDLYKKQKQNKRIIIIVFCVIVGAILIFGVYNTFIKKSLTEKDAVLATVNAYPGEILYPTDLLTEYIRHNINELVGTVFTSGKFEVDRNSLEISKVRYISDTVAEVYFSVDLIFDIKDTNVTNPYVIDKIQKEGQSSGGMNTVRLTEDGLTKEYIKNGDSYTLVGGQIRSRYTFMAPIEFSTTKIEDSSKDNDGDKATAPFLKLASNLELCNLIDSNQSDFTKIHINDRYSFENVQKLDSKDESHQKIVDKVTKTLDDLYAHRDTSQDFLNVRKFNSQNATFDKIDKIEIYTGKNAAGANVYVEYTIITEEGYKLKQTNYLVVEESGNSYVITAIL